MGETSRPLLVFDGHCGFCRAWVARWQGAVQGHVDVAPSQEVADAYPEIPAAAFAQSVVLIEPGGEVRLGAAAVFRALACAPGRGLAWWAYRHVPAFAAASETAYGVVARHRGAATAVTRLLWGAHVTPPGERFTAWVFVRLVAFAYVVAFASLGVQLMGLVGHEGVLPAAEYLRQLAAHYGPERFLLLPTLAWLGAGDGALAGLCIGGAVAALLALFGVGPRAMLLAAWTAYLSLACLGGEFMWFQWDSLLLECGLVAALLAPWRAWSRPRDAWQPARAAVWLSRWLLFRLVFSSAVVKWTSHDPTWRAFTALRFHYETQPLPPWTAWYAHHLPGAFQSFSVLAMFASEGLAPLLVAAPRRARMLGAAGIALLQVLIVLTGNYGFFNLLTLALCVMLLDDAAWPAWLRARTAPRAADPEFRPAPARAATVAAITIGVLGVCPFAGTLRVPPAALGPLEIAYEAVAPLRSISAYGLFAVMTTRRLEIVVEGSNDGVRWRTYPFRFKPGDPRRRPQFVPGHMPRLDWQMWFAALDPGRPAYWFLRFAQRLLEGSPPVLGLLASNPFPAHPPRYLRATLARYRFTDAATRRESGAWWAVEPGGTYLPPVRLEAGRLVLATELAPAR